MAAVGAPPEAPVAVVAPTAETVTAAPPTPETPAAPPEGDAAPETDGGEVKDYSAIEADLEAEVSRRVEERATKAEADAAKRGLQRTKEADDGESARMQLYATAEAAAQRSAATLRQLASTGEVNDAVLTEHFNPIIAGVNAITAKANEGTVKELIDLLPDMTTDEQEKLEPLLYDFRRNGRFDKLPATVAELALARKDAEIADLKKQVGERTSIKAAAEKLAAATVAAGPGVGSETPKGKSDATPTTYDQYLALSEADKASFNKANPEKFSEFLGIGTKG